MWFHPVQSASRTTIGAPTTSPPSAHKARVFQVLGGSSPVACNLRDVSRNATQNANPIAKSAPDQNGSFRNRNVTCFSPKVKLNDSGMQVNNMAKKTR